MSTILLNSVTFRYETSPDELFQDLSLLIDTAWRTAIVGRNGRGKTTLLRLVAGLEEPLAGTVECSVPTTIFPAFPGDATQSTYEVLRASVAPFSLWESEMERLAAAGTDEDLARISTLQERFQEAGGYEIEAAIHREYDHMGLPAALLDRPFRELSGGEQTRSLIAGLFLRPEDFALIDEPTNHLDMSGREQLTRYLAAKRGFVLVSHDRSLLDACVDHVIAVNRNEVRTHAGNYSTWKLQMDRERQHEERTREALERSARQLQRAAQQRRTWSLERERDKTAHTDKGYIGARAAKQMKRATRLARRRNEDLEARRALIGNLDKERVLKIATQEPKSGRVLTLNNLTLHTRDRVLFENLSLEVERGARVAILGANGCGKTTLINTICGEFAPHSGIVSLPAHVRISRAYQLPLWSSGNLRTHLREAGLDETRFRQILGVLGVEGELFDHPLQTLSQGELKKADLARSLMTPADLLLWDEPTNYVDIQSREQIADAILDAAPTLIFIDHDRFFVEQIATAVVALDAL